MTKLSMFYQPTKDGIEIRAPCPKCKTLMSFDYRKYQFRCEFCVPCFDGQKQYRYFKFPLKFQHYLQNPKLRLEKIFPDDFDFINQLREIEWREIIDD